MIVTKSKSYGLLAVGYIAKSKEKKFVQAGDISKEYNIHIEYLLKILQHLVRANVLRSKRGPRGGFSLTRPLKKINLLQIIEAVEGPMISNLHLEDNAKGEKFCKRVDQAYDKALTQARNVFKSVNLSDLAK